VVFDGELEAPTAGEYLFEMASDDGGRILVNGKKVLEHDGLHGAAHRKAPVELAAPGDIAGIEMQTIEFPRVDVVALPPLSELDELGTLISSEISDAFNVGIDVVTVPCTDEGAILYQPEDSFLEVDGGTLSVNEGGRKIDVAVNDDGSGTYDRSSDEGLLQVEVNNDGSGTYYFSHKGNSVGIQVNEDGTGLYEESAESVLDIEITGEGEGRYYRVDPGLSDAAGVTETVVNGDGSGFYTNSRGQFADEFRRDADGLIYYEYAILDPRQLIELTVNPDGSGTLNNDITGVTISVAADGSGTYESGTDYFEFATDLGIMDPALITAGPFPEFVAMGSFPPLDSLPSISAPCATIIRLDSTVLFDFDSDQLREQATPILDEAALAIIAADRPIEINGHTDSIGAAEYNLDLSSRRADAVRAALVDRGVDVEMSTSGFGETQPVADNENADGSDNPAGRQANRRVDIVIRN